MLCKRQSCALAECWKRSPRRREAKEACCEHIRRQEGNLEAKPQRRAFVPLQEDCCWLKRSRHLLWSWSSRRNFDGGMRVSELCPCDFAILPSSSFFFSSHCPRLKPLTGLTTTIPACHNAKEDGARHSGHRPYPRGRAGHRRDGQREAGLAHPAGRFV